MRIFVTGATQYDQGFRPVIYTCLRENDGSYGGWQEIFDDNIELDHPVCFSGLIATRKQANEQEFQLLIIGGLSPFDLKSKSHIVQQIKLDKC